jgi:GTP-binding protein
MKILSSEFVTSATEASQYPKGGLPEIAIAGRSNVGKSSLLNMLLGCKDLARVSQTPGRTRLLNFFRVAFPKGSGRVSGLVCVDFPGYGYAKVSKAAQEQWEPMIMDYLTERTSLCGLIVLIDIRRGEEEELQLVRLGKRLGIGVVAVATKIDKISRGQRHQALVELESLLGVPVLGCSAKTGEGKDALWKAILQLLASARWPTMDSDQK